MLCSITEWTLAVTSRANQVASVLPPLVPSSQPSRLPGKQLAVGKHQTLNTLMSLQCLRSGRADLLSAVRASLRTMSVTAQQIEQQLKDKLAATAVVRDYTFDFVCT